MFCFVVRKEQGGNKGKRFPPGVQCLPCLPPGVHDGSAREIPRSVALSFGNQRIPLTLELGLELGCTAPTKQRHRPLSTPSTLEDMCSVGEAREVKIVDVVSRDDVGVVFQHRRREAFKDLNFRALIGKGMALARPKVLNPCGSAEHRFLLDARFEVKREDFERDLKRCSRFEMICLAPEGYINAVSAAASRFDDAFFHDGAVVFTAVNELTRKFKMHAEIPIEKQAVDERNIA